MKKKTIITALSIIIALFIFLNAAHAEDFSPGISLLAMARYESDFDDSINYYLKAGSDEAADDLYDIESNDETFMEIEDIGHIVLSKYIIDPLDSWTNKSS